LRLAIIGCLGVRGFLKNKIDLCFIFCYFIFVAPKGKFITIEGCEGVGKTTHIELLKAYCTRRGIDALFTREPGGTPIAESIRNVILHEKSDGMDGLTELFLYAACRFEHTHKIILPALKSGKVVFCDRYTDSTLAYQGYARGLDKQVVADINQKSSAGVIIECTLFLDLPPALGLARMSKREDKNRLDKEGLDFHNRVYNGFLEIAKSEPNRVKVINASGAKEQTFEGIIATLKQRGIF